MLENKMVLDEYWQTEQKDWDKYYEHLAEEDDRSYEDEIFEEMN